MATFETTPQFRRDFTKLSGRDQERFRMAARALSACLDASELDPRLRVKKFNRRRGVDWWELSWSSAGRALFQYGPTVRLAKPHVIWLAVGTHAIFANRQT